jgi:hypothetical protein
MTWAALADWQPATPSSRKHVLAWADVRNGYQHDSISHAVATVERSGANPERTIRSSAPIPS